MQRKALKLSSPNKLYLYLLLIIGSLSWCLTMFKSGLAYSFGLGFWGPHGHDGVWHLSLASGLSRGSFDMPTFSGSLLQNYHLGFDLGLAIVHNLTSIPLSTLYFQILPPVIALSIGALTYILVLSWRNSKYQALWSVFFVYFGGSWGWMVSLLRGNGLGGESMFWSQQAISTLVNPPFALSLVFVLSGLIFLDKLIRTKRYRYMVLSVFFFGTLIQVKAYAAVLGLAGLFFIALFELLKNKNRQVLAVFFVATVLNVVLILPFQTLENVFVWQPFWYLETMMGLSDRYNWPRFYEAMVNYRSGGSYKAVVAYSVAFALFWFGNLGTRLIKEVLLLKWLRDYKKIKQIDIFIASIIVTGVLIPTFFLQKGTPWNTIQFIYYSLFFSSILAGCVLGEFLQTKALKAKVVLSVLTIALTIPTSLSTLMHYLPSRPPAKVSKEETEALDFLYKQQEGVVLTYPFDKAKADEAISNPPRPLYLYESTAYVSAFSNKPVFLEDEINLEITGYEWKIRKEEVLEFYNSLDQELVQKFLSKNKIRYIYWVKPQRAKLGETQLGIERIFENKEVDIYQVKH